jgi:site-specific recombinase XerD
MKAKRNEGENDMNAIARRITETPAASPQEMAMRIKTEAPTLADLNNEQLEQIARLVMTQRLAAELNTAVDLAGIDWQKERVKFLETARSDHTRRAYSAALGKLETWTGKEKINPLELSPGQADNFILNLRKETSKKTGSPASVASVRRDISAISAFYSFLERDLKAGTIKNPVRGTRIRPPKENKKDTVIPKPQEYKYIIKTLPLLEKAIVVTLAMRGLRAGALPSLELKEGKYHGKSKGKVLKEDGTTGITLPMESLTAIKAAGLDPKKPFIRYSADAIERRINRHIGAMYQDGKISAAYSCHDFRHFYAVQEYKKNKDIYRLSKLLNHAGIQITEIYLKSLGIKL